MTPCFAPRFSAMSGVVIPWSLFPKPWPSFHPIFIIILCAGVIFGSFASFASSPPPPLVDAPPGPAPSAVLEMAADEGSRRGRILARLACASSPVTLSELRSIAPPLPPAAFSVALEPRAAALELDALLLARPSSPRPWRGGARGSRTTSSYEFGLRGSYSSSTSGGERAPSPRRPSRPPSRPRGETPGVGFAPGVFDADAGAASGCGGGRGRRGGIFQSARASPAALEARAACALSIAGLTSAGGLARRRAQRRAPRRTIPRRRRASSTSRRRLSPASPTHRRSRRSSPATLVLRGREVAEEPPSRRGDRSRCSSPTPRPPRSRPAAALSREWRRANRRAIGTSTTEARLEVSRALATRAVRRSRRSTAEVLFESPRRARGRRPSTTRRVSTRRARDTRPVGHRARCGACSCNLPPRAVEVLRSGARARPGRVQKTSIQPPRASRVARISPRVDPAPLPDASPTPPFLPVHPPAIAGGSHESHGGMNAERSTAWVTRGNVVPRVAAAEDAVRARGRRRAGELRGVLRERRRTPDRVRDAIVEGRRAAHDERGRRLLRGRRDRDAMRRERRHVPRARRRGRCRARPP